MPVRLTFPVYLVAFCSMRLLDTGTPAESDLQRGIGGDDGSSSRKRFIDDAPALRQVLDCLNRKQSRGKHIGLA